MRKHLTTVARKNSLLKERKKSLAEWGKPSAITCCSHIGNVTLTTLKTVLKTVKGFVTQTVEQQNPFHLSIHAKSVNHFSCAQWIK